LDPCHGPTQRHEKYIPKTQVCMQVEYYKFESLQILQSTDGKIVNFNII
jgi:hypothetical protein